MCNDFLGWLCTVDGSKQDNLVVRTFDPPHSDIKENKLTIPVAQYMEEPPLIVYTNLGGTSPVSVKPCSLSSSPPTTPSSSLTTSSSVDSTHDHNSDSEDFSPESDLPEVPGFLLKKRRAYSI